MKSLLIIGLLFWTVTQANGAYEEIRQLRSQFDPEVVAAGNIDFSYSFTDWKSHWRHQAGAAILQPLPEFAAREDLMVFHSRAYFRLSRPVEAFDSVPFLDIEFAKKLDPTSRMELLEKSADASVVKTVSEFPQTWQEAMKIGRLLKHLSEDNVGYLEVTSHVRKVRSGSYRDFESQALADIKPPDFEMPRFFVMQNGNQVNQMSPFVSTLVSLYKYTDTTTLVAMDFVFALETDIDDKVNEIPGIRVLMGTFLGLDGGNMLQALLMGGLPGLSKGSGISQGMPGHALDISENLKKALEAHP